MPDDPDAIDIFDEDGALTREFLLQRGYCCQNGCRNCPYGFKKPSDTIDTTPAGLRRGKWSARTNPPTTQ